VSILEVARILVAQFGTSAPEPVVTGRFRAGDVRHIVASPEKASLHLGFKARVGLDDGMADLAAEPIMHEASG
jgi:dTDP-L-rhamnose 4-epimerase